MMQIADFQVWNAAEHVASQALAQVAAVYLFVNTVMTTKPAFTDPWTILTRPMAERLSSSGLLRGRAAALLGSRTCDRIQVGSLVTVRQVNCVDMWSQRR